MKFGWTDLDSRLLLRMPDVEATCMMTTEQNVTATTFSSSWRHFSALIRVFKPGVQTVNLQSKDYLSLLKYSREKRVFESRTRHCHPNFKRTLVGGARAGVDGGVMFHFFKGGGEAAEWNQAEQHLAAKLPRRKKKTQTKVWRTNAGVPSPKTARSSPALSNKDASQNASKSNM